MIRSLNIVTDWEMPFMRYSQGSRSGRIHREDLIDFEAHNVVAFAGLRRESRSVDLDLTSSIGFDRTGCAQIAHQDRHRRSSHTKHLRQRFLGEREDVVVDSVTKME